MESTTAVSDYRILGVDPGSRLTGFGCISVRQRQITLLDHGTLNVMSSGFDERLHKIYLGLSEVIQRLKPQAIVVEKVFFAKNVESALKLGQARGAVLLTGKIHQLDFFEYSPTEVKAAVVGAGRADKEQVARMLRMILGKGALERGTQFETEDASDAVALAVCHAHKRPVVRFQQASV